MGRSFKLFLLGLILNGPLLFGQIQWYNAIRYNDIDFSYLKNDTVDKDFFNPIKYISLNEAGNSYLTIGGEIRATYQYNSNENWGDIPPTWKDNDGFIWQRFMMHTDFKFAKSFRFFAQLISTNVISRAGGARATIDKDEFDIHQLFAEWKFFDSKNSFKLRLGRQEFNYGWGKLISIREGPNNRQSFDGAVVMFNNLKFKTDVFYGKSINVNPYLFDNKITNDDQVYGFYNTLNVSQKTKTSLDFYYIGYTKKDLRLAGVTANDYRNTIGFRLFTFKSGWIYDWESIYQFGDFGVQKSDAYSIVGMIGYDWKTVKWTPKVMIYGGITTGDKKSNDEFIETFNPMYQRPPFPLAFPLGATNINAYQTDFSIRPTKHLKTGIGMYGLWRNSIADGLYSPDVSQVRSAESNEHKIADIFYTDAEYVTRHLALNIQIVYSKPNAYLKDTGNGKEVFYTFAQIGYKF